MLWSRKQRAPYDEISACCAQLPCDAWQGQRQAVMARHELSLEQRVRCGQLSPRLLACMRILTANAKELDAMHSDELDPFQARTVSQNCSFADIMAGVIVTRK